MSDLTATLSHQTQQQGSPVQGAPPRPGIVSAMSAVWRDKRLTLLEVGWRWAVGLPLLLVCGWKLGRVPDLVALDRVALENVSVFQAAAAARTLQAAIMASLAALLGFLAWFVPCGLLAWSLAAGWGRTRVWRRLEPRLHPRPGLVTILGALRTAWLLALWVVWAWLVELSVRTAITRPAARGGDPNLVLFCAMIIGASLGLFLVWCATSWALEAAPLMIAGSAQTVSGSIGRALRLGRARSQVIEINLVMGIVRVALLILAMVFSACPLPFQSVESPAFLAVWWTGVGLAYLVASDYFKVVRTASYLYVLQSAALRDSGLSSGLKDAS